MGVRISVSGKPRLTWGVQVVYLTKRQHAILWLFMCRPLVSAVDIIEALWPDPDLEPDYGHEVVRIIISQLRKKMAEVGLGVQTAHGQGYLLVPYIPNRKFL